MRRNKTERGRGVAAGLVLRAASAALTAVIAAGVAVAYMSLMLEVLPERTGVVAAAVAGVAIFGAQAVDEARARRHRREMKFNR